MSNFKKNYIEELLYIIQQKYNKKLSMYAFENIEKVCKVLEEKREKVKLNNQSKLESNNNLDKDTKEIFELMSKYAEEIKQIFINNNEYIVHTTDVSPKNMAGGKISRSINRVNNYETARGDWVFAYSGVMIGKNPYIARKSKDGMALIVQNIYIYGGDNFQIQNDEYGQIRVILKSPNYVYKINPKKFEPVVTLKRDENGKPFFEFSGEWVSNEDIDIRNMEQVLGVEEVVDITEVIRNYQVLCDVNKENIAMKIRNSSNIEEVMYKLFVGIQSGELRYINGESNINISPLIQSFGLVNNIEICRKSKN